VGNLVSEGTARRFAWDHVGLLKSFRVQTGDAEPSVHVQHLHSAEGQRVLKVVRRQGGQIQVTVCIDEVFERRALTRGGQTRTHDVVHVMDNLRRVALVRDGDPFPDDETPAVAYHLADHVESTSIVVGGATTSDATLAAREEYAPHGRTTFGGVSGKRHRFAGRERDEETGLTHHRARYYAPWLRRWISPDPAGPVDGPNLYVFGRNNPIRYIDPTGTSAWSWIKSASVSVYRFEYGLAKKPYEWESRAYEMVKDGLSWAWERTKQLADNIWGWTKRHWILGTAAAIGVAIGAILAYRAREKIWNWIVAPAVRATTNAVIGYAIGGRIGAVVGAATGLVHGLQMASAQSYDWKSPQSWAAFVLDNSWGLFNSFIGSAFATANLGREIDETVSKGSNSVYFKERWFGDYDTTLGNVTVGNTVPRHEAVHAWQARIAGPFYMPAVILNYEVWTVAPIWLLWNKSKISSFGDYFTKGVYPNTFHEMMAYGVEGSPP
jgi:RHS repeat-associated protein